MNKEKELSSFKQLSEIRVPQPLRILAKTLVISFFALVLFLVITPWRQTSKGFGHVIASNPNNRTQNINASTSGRISKWYVSDGMRVKAGDKLAEIVDNDPLILDRLKTEKLAKEGKLGASQSAAQTAKINYERQQELYKKGLSSRREFEQAKIEYQKLLGTQQSDAAELAESQTKLSRQESQLITAPGDGTILKVLAGNNSTIVKAGDKIATFAPNLTDPAVELYVNGNDIPLIHEGRKVRLQFEGWPAVQFSGWPSISVGTFAGVVSSVDASISENGKFRVIVKKDGEENWPDNRFLRHGAKVYGWVLLNQVRLAYEIWRQINSFPPDFSEEIKGKNDEENAK
jgi:RND family efflux transporter MFP subunit